MVSDIQTSEFLTPNVFKAPLLGSHPLQALCTVLHKAYCPARPSIIAHQKADLAFPEPIIKNGLVSYLLVGRSKHPKHYQKRFRITQGVFKPFF